MIAIVVALVTACSSRDRSESRDRAQPAPTPAASPAAADPWAAQEPTALPPPVVTDPLEHPFVWSAKRDGKTTYLFGTVHAGVDAERRIPAWVWRLFEDAPTLVEEVNLQDVTLAQWTIRPPGPTLREELGEPYWTRLEQAVTPLVAGLLDTQSTSMAALRVSGYGGGAADAAWPMDGALLVRAQGLKKRIVFLETVTEHTAVLANLHDIASVKRLLDHTRELAPLNAAFFTAYLGGDEQALADVARRQFLLGVADEPSLRVFVDRLLLARNRAWLAAIEAEHATGGAFVAVGVLHLVGRGSVLELLGERGFTIERLAAPGTAGVAAPSASAGDDCEPSSTSDTTKFGVHAVEVKRATGNPYRWADRRGRILATPHLFDNGPDYWQEGFSRIVDARGKMGFIDERGTIIVPPTYDWVYPFCGGIAKTALDGKAGYIDRQGRPTRGPPHDTRPLIPPSHGD